MYHIYYYFYSDGNFEGIIRKLYDRWLGMELFYFWILSWKGKVSRPWIFHDYSKIALHFDIGFLMISFSS